MTSKTRIGEFASRTLTVFSSLDLVKKLRSPPPLMQTEILQQRPLFLLVAKNRTQVAKPSFWSHQLWVRTTSSRSTQVLKPWLLLPWTWEMGRILHVLWLTTRSSSAQATRWWSLGQGLQTQSPSSCMLAGHGFLRMQRPWKKKNRLNTFWNMFFLRSVKGQENMLQFKNMLKLLVKTPVFWLLYLDLPQTMFTTLIRRGTSCRSHRMKTRPWSSGFLLVRILLFAPVWVYFWDVEGCFFERSYFLVRLFATCLVSISWHLRLCSRNRRPKGLWTLVQCRCSS